MVLFWWRLLVVHFLGSYAEEAPSVSTLTAVLPTSFIPIQVNVFLLGLDGTGHLGVNIPQDRLQHWLAKLDASVPEYVTESLDRVTSKEKEAAVVYRYHYRLVPIASHVLSVVERLLECNYRSNGKELQVNPRIFATLLEDLVSYLGLSSSFNLFVLNPRKFWMKEDLRYGYRDGLSDEEVQIISQDAELHAALQSLAFNRTQPISNADKKRQTTDRALPSDAIERSLQWAERQNPRCTPPGQQRQRELIRVITAQQPRRAYEEASAAMPRPESCLLDTWVGTRRVGFIDLAAGPFEWGPVIGGEGLRTKASLPNVSTFVANVTDSQEQPVDVKPRFDWEAIEAEKVMLESFLAAECQGRDSLPQCAEMRKKLGDINAFVSKAQPVDAAAERDFEHANAFSFLTHKLGKALHSDSLIQHQFLAHLSSTISSLHHLITPPLSGAAALSSGFASRVIFHVYVLRNHNQDVGLGALIQELEEALIAMKLPQQTFTFAVRVMNMDDDPRLALAFATSMRSTVIPTLTEDGMFEANTRLYLHSKSLQFELTRIDDLEDAQPENDHHEAGAREIPIFIFSLEGGELPVLVDKHFQSQVVGELVVATQSSHPVWRSDLMCNGKPMFWDLRNPVKAIVQSALQVLAGVVPTHIPTQASATTAATTTQGGGAGGGLSNDWKWSVGSHVCAVTAAGVEVSSLHVDIIRRSYVTSAIRYGHKQLEAIREQLLSVPQDRAAKFMQSRDKDFVELHKTVQRGLSSLATCAANDEDCFETIPAFMTNAKLLASFLPKLSEGAVTAHCEVPPPPGQVGLMWYLALASLCLATCLRVGFTRSGKLKINQD